MEQNKKYSSREEQALAEAGRTAISITQKRILAAVFLLTIFFVPVSQQILDIRAGLNGSRKSAVPQCYDIFKSAFSALKKICRTDGRIIGGIMNANRRLLREMHAYEDSLEDLSLVGKAIRPSVQYAMTSLFGAGNDKTYCGRDNWLFYRPDVDYVINHGFLEKDIMARRAASGSETAAAPHPDPRPAILAFNAELAARGIKLILMPTPVKPVIHPEKLAGGFEKQCTPVQNRSYQTFIKTLKNAGVPVFDPAQALVNDKTENKRNQFIAGDTHWRPEAMELCARNLRDFIKMNISLPARLPVGYTALQTKVVQRGDIVAMLRLPKSARKFGAANVNIRQIFGPDGGPWQPDKEADVLILGDSFSNIYSLEAMGWGKDAGFVEQLSYEMQRPLDRIIVNDNGAWAARETIWKALAGGKNRLAGKRVVIWQFAVRELTEGDWKTFTLNQLVQHSSFLTLSPGSELIVSGTIQAIARVPRLGSAPYADHIIAARLANVRDRTKEHGQALVYMFSMTNHVLTRAAGFKVGDNVNLRLRSWAEVSEKYERINRAELDDPELLVQEPCWGDLIPDKR